MHSQNTDDSHTTANASPTRTRYRLSVCPHDTAKNGPAWFFLNTYMQRQLGQGIHFEPRDSFLDERQQVLAGGHHLVYANPYSAFVFAQMLGFVPVARPVGVFDETVLVAPASAALPANRPLRLASATDKLIVHALGLTLLPGLGLSAGDCSIDFVGTHVKAAHAVLQGKADLGFVYRTGRGLAASSRADCAVLGEPKSRQAYHCFCVGPDWADQRERVQALLCGMKDDPKGQRVLEDLNMPAGFEPVGPDELQALRSLVGGA
jgi:phosphonate transport system substrate-binding protein